MNTLTADSLFPTSEANESVVDPSLVNDQEIIDFINRHYEETNNKVVSLNERVYHELFSCRYAMPTEYDLLIEVEEVAIITATFENGQQIKFRFVFEV
jgi:hypothetical protein